MQIKVFEEEYSVIRLKDITDVDFSNGFVSLTKTDDEISVICESVKIPNTVIDAECGWRMLKICGVLDFSLVGILAGISGVLSKAAISIFVISTYNTDYILIKSERLNSAITVLSQSGYEICFD